MKITLYTLLFFSIFLCGCTNNIKITRTIPLKIDLLYNINQVGPFTAIKVINESDLNERLNDAGYLLVSGKVEKIDLESIAVGANVESANTAQTIQIDAQVDTDAGTKVLLNKSKVIEIVSSRGGDVLNALGNMVGIDKNKITLRNAVDLLNAVGAKDFEGKIQNMITGGINGSGIVVRLNGAVPANQRLVMNLNIQVSIQITYSTCEEWVELFPLGSCDL